MENKRVQYIDAWRFFAIALVIISHLIEFSHPFYKETWPGLIWRVHPLGRLGVHIFFCLSGYVICRGMLNESRAYGSVSLRGFYVRRAFRILPPLALYMAFIGVMVAFGIFEAAPSQFGQAAAFLCNIEYLGNCGWYFGHTWSLAFEEQFYLVFPVLFSVMALAQKRGRLLVLVLVLSAAAILMRLLSLPDSAYYLSIFAYMLWGCLYAFFEDVLQPVLRRMPIMCWLGIGATLLATNFVALPANVVNFVYPAIAPLAICALVFGTPLRHPLVRRIFFDWRLVYLGQVSYTVYLWQQVATNDYGFDSPLVAVMLMVFVFGLAHLSYKFFEMPLVRIGRALSSQKTRTGTSTPAVFTNAQRIHSDQSLDELKC